MTPVARHLSERWGVLEALQTRPSIPGLIRELARVVAGAAAPPVVLAGFSWGAWLGILYARRYPEQVAKLILIGCGPLEEKYLHRLRRNREKRLDPGLRDELQSLETTLLSPALSDHRKKKAMVRLGEIYSRIDAFHPLKKPLDGVNPDPRLYIQVWREAARYRKTGELLRSAHSLSCPVVAIHGDFDPHPLAGVVEPLRRLPRFRWIQLENCGHKPWIESGARARFYRLLEQEVESS